MTPVTTTTFIIETWFLTTLLIGAVGCADEASKEPATHVKSEQHHSFWYGSPRWYERVKWKPEEHFQTPEMIEFCRAIQRNDLPAVQKLLKSGIDVNKTGKDNATLLLWAYSSPDPTCFRLLLEHGADPNVEFHSNFGTGGGLFGYDGLFEGDCVTLLASRLPDNGRFGLVAEHGGDLGFVHGEHGTTPLIAAAGGRTSSKVRQQIVARIIAAKVDLNKQTPNGGTALSAALNSVQYDIVSMLLDAGADPCLFDFRNHQLLHVAASRELSREEGNRDRREAGVVEIQFSGMDHWDQMIKKLEKAAEYTLKEAHRDLQLQNEWREKGLGDFLAQRRRQIEKDKASADKTK